MLKHNVDRNLKSGVFPYLINSAAFVDRIELSAGEQDHKNPAPLIRRRLRCGSIESKPIGGKGSFYGRLLQGRSRYSGNPVDLKYGKVKAFARVPSFRVVMRSDRVPLTAAQVIFATQNLRRLRVSLVEMTFDLAGISIDDISYQLFARAGIHDHRGTIYVGSQHSDWQLRIYKKTDSIVRLEFIFRRGFLQEHGLRCPSELIKLRTVNIWHLICLRQLQKDAFLSVLAHIPADESGWKGRFRRVADSYPQVAERILRTQCQIPTEDLFLPSPTHRLLQRMQRQLIW